VFDNAKRYTEVPKVLDLGAGEGSVTLPFLELGADVTAVDISSSQLEALKHKCKRFERNLELYNQDINEFLKENDKRYDVIVANSFLHHIPDYIDMIDKSILKLVPNGQFFSFQDPCRYDSCGKVTAGFSKLAYFSWRMTRGDIVGGIKRKIRRSRGVFLDDSVEDNAEYHVIRNGVDQDAISRLFEAKGYCCEIIPYFSTQSRLFQSAGARLGMVNTFATIAQNSNR
jgi:SAM-dependent methyltransferase